MSTPSAEAQFQQKLAVLNKAKETYWRLYRDPVDNMSVELLEEFAKILKEDNVTFNKEVSLKDFQENLLADVLQSIEKSWEACNIGVNIAPLEMLKDRFRDRQKPNWRPHNKSADEQTLPIWLQRLEAERRYLKKQTDFQNSKLEELMEHNRRYRNEVGEIRVQRSFMLDQIHRDSAEQQNLKKEYAEMIGQVLFKG